MTLLEQICLLAEPLIASHGLSLWGAEYAAGPRGVLRLFVEGPEGVTIDQCAEVSRVVGLTLDVEDIIPDPYMLEVSSPGLERVFFTEEQLASWLDKEVALSFKNAPAGFPKQKNFFGRLKAYAEGVFTLLIPAESKKAEDAELTFAWGQLKKARAALPAAEAPAQKSNKKKQNDERKSGSAVRTKDTLEEENA